MKPKKRIKVLVIAVVGVVGVLGFLIMGIGCSSIKQVSTEEFVRISKELPTPMSNSEYIGCTGTRAYIEVWNMPILGIGGTRILWAPLNEFSPELKRDMQEGKDPFPKQEGEDLSPSITAP